MNLEALIAAARAALAGLQARHDGLVAEARSILSTVEAEGRSAAGLTEDETKRHLDVLQKRGELAEQIKTTETQIDTYERALEDEKRVAAGQQQGQQQGRGYDQQARITSEERTYHRGNDPKGIQFATDVVRGFMFGDAGANQALSRHMNEEVVERGKAFFDRAADANGQQRAAGTGAFTGLVVPQYLTDEFAAFAKAGRPLANTMRHHDLPASGMQFNIGRGTTATSVALQASENATVSETDYDDTLLSLNVLTAAGSQTVTRQAIDRGVGVDDTVIEDLMRGWATNLDNQVINQATTGLSAVATAIAYTDATPTGPELYPKLLAAPAAVEAALLDQGLGDTIAVMHSRRWYWLQSQLTSSWPLLNTPNSPAQSAGEAYVARYGSGFRGILPAGVPVIVDNNISTLLGAGTEDEIYFLSPTEAHLFEDPNAPLLIRAEQPSAKKLGVDLVVYGYFAYTFTRRPSAQKVNGTGLIAPTF